MLTIRRSGKLRQARRRAKNAGEMSLDANAIDVRAGAEGVCVSEGCCAGEAGDVGLDGREGCWWTEVGGALKEVGAIGDALPGDDDG